MRLFYEQPIYTEAHIHLAKWIIEFGRVIGAFVVLLLGSTGRKTGESVRKLSRMHVQSILEEW